VVTIDSEEGNYPSVRSERITGREIKGEFVPMPVYIFCSNFWYDFAIYFCASVSCSSRTKIWYERDGCIVGRAPAMKAICVFWPVAGAWSYT